jgi:transcriptional regulator with XRE-family HTH domain
MELMSKKDARLKFRQHIISNGIKQKYLCGRMKISQTHLHFILNGVRTLSEQNREKLNLILNTNY